MQYYNNASNQSKQIAYVETALINILVFPERFCYTCGRAICSLEQCMFAVISDVHSNLEALTVVLTDIEKRGIETIYCLGDVVGYGNV
jgi:hypothetical protein